MQIKHLAVILGTALAAHAAVAADIDWGAHGTLELVAQTVDPGDFSDTIFFTLPKDTGLAATAVSNNLLSVLGIMDGTLSLYFDKPGPDTLIGSFSFDGTTGSSSLSFAPTLAGDYYYLVSGTATGSSGGFYSLSSTTLPVPEPRTWSLALSGLMAAGLVARRRRNS